MAWKANKPLNDSDSDYDADKKERATSNNELFPNAGSSILIVGFCVLVASILITARVTGLFIQPENVYKISLGTLVISVALYYTAIVHRNFSDSFNSRIMLGDENELLKKMQG